MKLYNPYSPRKRTQLLQSDEF